ncbi:formylglycine-generating enzyme required for sulfatase activity/serine/threonine protein phosphatase PrpC [Methylohalomonas lacus]|uniref:Formylglycine-generating enzyme required for sulfatase activity/serine/threonine protein phosphatase PrpC n=1 Tax=Methylohalomonas lacus TaxID=398773 RepID=A0AAE3L3T5_9GAMM|nr:SUMF1/EgtB/PvdO family nonheme iron enzyme [Methylohalomonas lacus]MCS3902708.1 formylglycine-generating enzyme required for sulfatase activity/serine/threonine protein phosphatase PrpC [Methylohalomonas lacus]
MGLQYEIAGNQIDGARDYQEDAFLVTHLTDAEGQPSVLAIVADGMGGHAAGNVASNMAVQAFNKYVSANYPSDDVTGLLQGGILKANGSIAETIRETPALQGMGCTMVAVLLEQNHLWWASVGDSHLYLLRDKQLSKKNADHSYGGFLDRLAAAGQPMEPEPGLSRNMLMSAVTGEEITEIDCPEAPLELQHDDRIILSSDGLDTLGGGKIIQFSEWSDKPKACVQTLLQAIEDEAMPRQDNTTVLVIDALSLDADVAFPPDSTASAGLAINDAGEVDLTDQTVPNAAAGSTISDAADPVPMLDITAGEDEIAPRGSDIDLSANVDETTADGRKRFAAAIAVIAGGVILIAVFGYYWLARIPGDEPGSEPRITAEQTASETARDAAPAPAEDRPASEPESAPAEEAETAPATASTTETEPVSAPLPKPAFRDPLAGGGQGPLMRPLPAGQFQMGSSRFREERPEHTVTVQRFAISQYEITIAEYERYARATGKAMPESFGQSRSDHPVINVSWADAAGYADWLSRQTGHDYRLPTEAEWEYAAAGGQETDYWWGVTMEPGRAYCFGCDEELQPRMPTAIGNFPANPYGVHDMLGNVAEWTADCWHPDYENANGTAHQPRQANGSCRLRGVRGGSYNSPPTSLRHSRRDKFDASQGYDNIGFRVVREMGD